MREHVLRRPDMYIGPLAPREETSWVLAKGDQAMEEVELKMSPAFVQVYNEILVNAVDQHIKGGMAMSFIDINVDPKDGSISVENDGGSIPVALHEATGLLTPTLVFGEFLSGDNFDDSDVRFVGGKNGVGAKAANVYSTRFQVEVKDPASGSHFRQTWEDNMRIRGEPEISELEPGTGPSVKVSFWPDLPRFGLKKIDRAHTRLLRARAYDAAACTAKSVEVRFNGKALKVADFEDYARCALGEKEIEVERITDEGGTVRAEIAVALSQQAGFKALGLVNGIRCSSGTHMRLVTDQLATGIAGLTVQNQKEGLTAANVRRHLKIVVKVWVDRPTFDSQTKSGLTSTAKKLGFNLELTTGFIRRAAELGILDAAMKDVVRSTQRVLRSATSTKISAAKLDDAVLAGKRKEPCTLILTEGDSAKALAVAGLSQVGRRTYGIFPLKGKLLNVRTASRKQLQSSHEIRNIVQAVGLDWGANYTSPKDVKKLRYQQIMIFSDQDLDGHHIAGLVINFIHANWPSLLEVCPDFIQRFATPIVKVFPKASKKAIHGFFTQAEYNAWEMEQERGWEKRHRIKYYKGLGTSSRAEAIEYFSDMDRHVIGLQYAGEGDGHSIERAFGKDRSQDRKDWIKHADMTAELDYRQSSVSIEEFFNQQFVHFSAYDCWRSIPMLLDGLKPSQRKVLHVVRRLKGERKVAQLTGLVSAETCYHHGEMSLVETTVGLAQTFVGTNNVNLLSPNGQFGTRLRGRSEHASGRYIYTEASELCGAVFRKEDDDVLRLQWEEGTRVEPKEFLPVLPLVLLNGFKGIGTGWATDGPNYHPLRVTEALERLIKGEEPGELIPWYDGFKGTMEVDEEGRWSSVGRWRVYSSEGPDEPPDTVEITELPVGAWTDDFIQRVEDTANSSKCMLSVYKCRDHDDERVHLLIGFLPSQLSRVVPSEPNATEAVARLLHLRRRVLLNMWLYHAEDVNAEPKLAYYETPQEVLRAFHRARRKHYERRRENLLEKRAHQADSFENKARFVRALGKRTLDINSLSLADTDALLEDQGFQRLTEKPSGEATAKPLDDADDAEPAAAHEASFNYLLKMPFSSQTRERAEELEKKRAQAASELERLRGTTVDELWLEDLKDFRQAYEKRQAARKAEGKDVAVKLSKQDDEEAQQQFRKERSKLSRKAGDSGSPMSPAALAIKQVKQLKELCQIQGIKVTGSKEDHINAILLSTSLAFTKQEWTGLPMDDLKAYTAARGLPPDGTKQHLVELLVRNAGLRHPRQMAVAELRAELEGYGFEVTGRLKKEELVNRVKLARAKIFAQERR